MAPSRTYHGSIQDIAWLHSGSHRLRETGPARAGAQDKLLGVYEAAGKPLPDADTSRIQARRPPPSSTRACRYEPAGVPPPPPHPSQLASHIPTSLLPSRRGAESLRGKSLAWTEERGSGQHGLAAGRPRRGRRTSEERDRGRRESRPGDVMPNVWVYGWVGGWVRGTCAGGRGPILPEEPRQVHLQGSAPAPSLTGRPTRPAGSSPA